MGDLWAPTERGRKLTCTTRVRQACTKSAIVRAHDRFALDGRAKRLAAPHTCDGCNKVQSNWLTNGPNRISLRVATKEKKEVANKWLLGARFSSTGNLADLCCRWDGGKELEKRLIAPSVGIRFRLLLFELLRFDCLCEFSFERVWKAGRLRFELGARTICCMKLSWQRQQQQLH